MFMTPQYARWFRWGDDQYSNHVDATGSSRGGSELLLRFVNDYDRDSLLSIHQAWHLFRFFR